MYVAISELFSYRQYVDFPVAYCFDRKTYRFCDCSHLDLPGNSAYERFIPLFQIDQKAIEMSFISSFHNQYFLLKYNASKTCFEEFAQQNNLWNQWWEYYKESVNHVAVQWCENNNIKYKNE